MAYEFDGAGDYITINKSLAATDLSALTYSFCIWKDTGSGAYREVFWMGGAWEFTFHTFSQLDVSTWGLVFASCFSGNHGKWSIGNPTDNVWTRYIVTYDFSSTTNDPKSWKDGVSQTITERITPTGTGNSAQDTSNLKLGSYSDGSAEYWDGKIAEFALWNRILTDTEISYLGAIRSPAFIPSGLVLYAPLRTNPLEVVGDTAGTVTNAINVASHPEMVYPEYLFNNYQGVDAKSAGIISVGEKIR